MKTKVTDTSLEAHRVILKTIGKKQIEVLNAIKKLQPCSDQMIAEYLQYTINRITGRRNELMVMGKIEECGKMKNKFGRNVTVWQVLTEFIQPKNKEQFDLFGNPL
jgi:hypothetical protein